MDNLVQPRCEICQEGYSHLPKVPESCSLYSPCLDCRLKEMREEKKGTIHMDFRDITLSPSLY